MPSIICTQCGASASVKRSWQKFCSEKCRWAAWQVNHPRRGREVASIPTTASLTACYYCGLPADTIDHVPPLSVRPRLLTFCPGRFHFCEVPACRECNHALGDRSLFTLPERRRFIKAWLQHRYRKVLRGPRWTEDELAQIGDTLHTYVIARAILADVVRARIARLPVAPAANGTMAPPIDERACAACGTRFRPKREWAKFCSTACRLSQYALRHTRAPIAPLGRGEPAPSPIAAPEAAQAVSALAELDAPQLFSTLNELKVHGSHLADLEARLAQLERRPPTSRLHVRTPSDPSTWKHGANCYRNHGCRCAICVDDMRAQHKTRRAYRRSLKHTR